MSKDMEQKIKLGMISLAAVMMVAGFTLGFMGDAAAMLIAMVAAGGVFVFAYSDRILSFKSGKLFELEMQTLQAKVDISHATLDHLRMTAHPLVLAALHYLTVGNRAGELYSEEEKRNLIEALNHACDVLEMKSPEYLRMKSEFNRLAALDHFKNMVMKLDVDSSTKDQLEKLTISDKAPTIDDVLIVLKCIDISDDDKSEVNKYRDYMDVSPKFTEPVDTVSTTSTSIKLRMFL